MVDDPYNIFTRCHRLYVEAVRRAVRERLQNAFGEHWWDLGVWPALSENQQQYLQVGMKREKRPDLVDYLDSGLFGGVVLRNHAFAFADAFPNLDDALGLFRRVAHTRNEWAHVPPQGLSANKANAAIGAMVSLLASLRCREALEVNRMVSQQPSEPKEASESLATTEPIRPDGDAQNEVADSAPGLWHELQSYLAVDSSVMETDAGQNDRINVKVRVANVAPVGEGRPEVSFRDVRLEVRERGTNRSVQLGRLGPGQAVEKEFAFHAKELASVYFGVNGDLEMERYFRMRRSAGLPEDVVGPLLQEFREGFGRIRIGEPLVPALEAVKSVAGDMTLVDAAKVRDDLKTVPPLLAEKEQRLQELFREFHLDKQTTLGANCHEVWRLLREAGSRIEAVDTAIGGTDIEAVQEAIRSLEELQIEILRVERMSTMPTDEA